MQRSCYGSFMEHQSFFFSFAKKPTGGSSPGLIGHLRNLPRSPRNIITQKRDLKKQTLLGPARDGAYSPPFAPRQLNGERVGTESPLTPCQPKRRPMSQTRDLEISWPDWDSLSLFPRLPEPHSRTRAVIGRSGPPPDRDALPPGQGSVACSGEAS